MIIRQKISLVRSQAFRDFHYQVTFEFRKLRMKLIIHFPSSEVTSWNGYA